MLSGPLLALSVLKERDDISAGSLSQRLQQKIRCEQELAMPMSKAWLIKDSVMLFLCSSGT